MQLDQKALIEEAVQASIDAGLAVNGEYGVAAARHAARFMFNALQAVQPVPVLTDEPEFQTAPDNGTVDEVLAYVLDCARRWEPKARIIGNARAGDIVRALTAIASAEPVVTEDAHQFKNFHRLLCERFGYCHDEKDWRRDQVSLIEHIAALTATASAEPVSDGFRGFVPHGSYCATEGCGNFATVHFIRGGIGSLYCQECYLKVQALGRSPSRTGGRS